MEFAVFSQPSVSPDKKFTKLEKDSMEQWQLMSLFVSQGLWRNQPLNTSPLFTVDPHKKKQDVFLAPRHFTCYSQPSLFYRCPIFVPITMGDYTSVVPCLPNFVILLLLLTLCTTTCFHSIIVCINMVLSSVLRHWITVSECHLKR